jgi:hypothetical protein
MLKVAEACGVEHPGLIGADMVDILLGTRQATPLWQSVGYDDPGWGLPSDQQREEICRLMAGAPEGGSAPPSSTAVDAPDGGGEEGVPADGSAPAQDARIDDSATPG